MNKTFVQVECKTLQNGTIRPSIIKWHDGRQWMIKRVLHVSQPAENEFEGIRYTIIIGNAEKYLYRNGDKWYVAS